MNVITNTTARIVLVRTRCCHVFSAGLFCASGVIAGGKKNTRDETSPDFIAAVKKQEEIHQAILSRPAGESNPYDIHRQLGDIMTRTATVVRRNDQLTQGL